jgi:phenylacetaldoxime dehydratase/aldoxime dehydratase
MTGRAREGHVPRFTAYSAQFPRTTSAFVFAQYGCQAPTRVAAGDAAAVLRGLFAEADGPILVDRGSFVDTAGEHNVVWLAYWQDPEAHRRWLASDQVRTRWDGLPREGPVGYWAEACVIPVDHAETLHTHRPEDYATSGLVQAVEVRETATHDYWGAARDRIPASAESALAPEMAVYAPRLTDTRGRRLSVEVPGNVALIRTAQDWSASTLYRETYLRDVKPVKDRGVDFLARHADSGCIAARNIDEETADGTALDRACTIAWFASLEHLMTWCKSHRTHLDIYASFFQMVGGGEGPLDVAFWHEVSVLPAGAVTAEYVNCHPATGFLPLAERHTALTV